MAAPARLFLPRTARATDVLDIVAWEGQFPGEEIDKFAEATGIAVQMLETSSDHHFLTLMRATGGREFDLLFPTCVFARKWEEFGLLRAFEEKDLPLGGIHPALMRAAERDWGFGGGLRWIPQQWRGELICWSGDSEWDGGDSKPGYGDLWDTESGRTAVGSALSLLLGAGLHLESVGAITAGSLEGSVKDVFRMRRTWDRILSWCARHKSSLERLCAPGEGETCLPAGGKQLGLAPDSSLLGPGSGNDRLGYVAAAEGPLVLAIGAAMPLGARNTQEAHAFLTHFLGAEAAAACQRLSGLNSAAVAAADALGKEERKRFAKAYGEGAVDAAYVLPGEPDWFRKRKGDYLERLAQALQAPQEEPG